MNITVRNHVHRVNSMAYGLLSLVLLCWSSMLIAEGETLKSPSVIGHVVLQIGHASVVHSSGSKEILKRGWPLSVGDLIETRAGGHVHIKFIDEAVISIRPESRLRIEEYKYDTQSPEKSAIRFTLDKGVMRSISGKATAAAHDRYRLNTPVAALGVLGTDYVVRANEGEIWVAVYSGGIAVAPLGGDCLAASLGVCDGATHLTKDMGNLVLSYKLGEQQVQLKSLTGALDEEGAVEIDPVPEVQLLNSTEAPIEEPLAEREQLGEELGMGIEQRELSGDLKWGRWWGDALTGDEISKPYAEAKIGRSITVGSSRFGLFRNTAIAFQLMPQQGVFNFDLVQSFVSFFDASAAAGTTPTQGKLQSGVLEIDFTEDTFSTHLNLTHPVAGGATLDVKGSIGGDGVFSSSNASSSVAGALTEDGKEAGLLFEHKINSGTFKGISDWAR
ncbi:MAG: FecR family protein [Cycloclasticus sp.]